MLVVWAERKVIADMQARIGPNRWGPFGLLQTLADGIKLFFKEDFRPRHADRWTYAIAPVAAMVPSFLAFAVIPFGRQDHVADRDIDLIVSDLNIGILLFPRDGLARRLRDRACGVGFGIQVPVARRRPLERADDLVRDRARAFARADRAGRRQLSTVDDRRTRRPETSENVTFFDGIPVLEQIADLFSYVPNWYIWSQWPGVPHLPDRGDRRDEPRAVRPSRGRDRARRRLPHRVLGIRFAMFFLGEYIHVVVISAMAVTLFFGGWDGPVLRLPATWIVAAVLVHAQDDALRLPVRLVASDAAAASLRPADVAGVEAADPGRAALDLGHGGRQHRRRLAERQLGGVRRAVRGRHDLGRPRRSTPDAGRHAAEGGSTSGAA